MARYCSVWRPRLLLAARADKAENCFEYTMEQVECPSNKKDINKKDFYNGWYNTGDVAFVDNEGYLFILGRLKRFAKIAGEMISLAQVENFPKKLWPENYSAVCNIKDVNKGETLILLTDNKKADLIELMKLMKEEGQSSLYFPKKIKIINEFPILGSGKIDFKKLQELAES